MSSIEEVLLEKVKFVGDGEWVLYGTPQETIDELSNYFVREVAVMAETVPPNGLLNEIYNKWSVPPHA